MFILYTSEKRWLKLNAIQNKMYLFAAASVIGGGLSAALFPRSLAVGDTGNASIASVILFVIAVYAAGLAFRQSLRLKAAQLITDNQILHINAAEILEVGTGSLDAGEDIEVFISCFGILLNDKIIKFNQEGIQLKSVEIDRVHILLTFGSSKRTRKIRLLYEKMDDEEMMRIVEKFRYETGIVPEIIKKEESRNN